MKKTIVLLFSIVSVFHLAAQTTLKPGIGVNLTNYSKDPVNGEISAKAGLLIGGSIAFGKKIYFEPGLFYVGKSTEIKGDDAGPVTDAALKGFRVPVVLGINLLGNEKSIISLRGFGGASGFFVTSVSDDVDEDEINKTNWGVLAGAGIDIWKVFLDVSYEWSVTNLQKNTAEIDFGKTRSLYITAGLRLNF